jgi:outer membrane protein TolC
MAVVAGGLTSEQAAQRAATTSFAAKSAEGTRDAASARIDAASVGYFPRLTLTARYTRYSSLTAPELSPGVTIPIFLDNYLAQANVTIPISDYLLRINQNYTAATKSEEAAQFDVIAARTKSYSDAKIAYYTWLRARAAISVAQQSLAVSRQHLKDSEVLLGGGRSSPADVLRAQTQVSTAELLLERAKAANTIAEVQLRVAMHAAGEEQFAPGESLETDLPAAPTNIKDFVAEGQSKRPEIKSLEKNAEAQHKLAASQRAARYPVVSAFGNLIYANPNPRQIPPSAEFFPTWDVGVQAIWSPNDLAVGGAGNAEAQAKAAAFEAQKNVFRDAVEAEIVQAYQDLQVSDTGIITTLRQLESAIEGYRVARELFVNGRTTGTALIDAEVVLAQTRFDQVNARVDARLARVRFEHAVGRDVKPVAGP